MQKTLYSIKDVLDFEKTAVQQGYEGIMLRAPYAPYKFGRSTLKEGYLMKLKRFEDSEAEVLKVFPRMKNENKLERDERGYAKRSAHKEGKQALAEIGGYIIRDLKTKKVFSCGTGVFTQKEREEQWQNRRKLQGKILKYRFQAAGQKELPRFPRALGWRSRIDF
jgi:DNA ligase-1